jgi:hypothetical protein
MQDEARIYAKTLCETATAAEALVVCAEDETRAAVLKRHIR